MHCTRSAVEDGRGYTVCIVLSNAGEFLIWANPTWAGCIGVGPQQWIEPNLRQVRESSRARLCISFCVGATAPCRNFTQFETVLRSRAGNRGVPDHLTPIIVVGCLCVDIVCDAHLMEDLHGA